MPLGAVWMEYWPLARTDVPLLHQLVETKQTLMTQHAPGVSSGLHRGGGPPSLHVQAAAPRVSRVAWEVRAPQNQHRGEIVCTQPRGQQISYVSARTGTLSLGFFGGATGGRKGAPCSGIATAWGWV